MPQVPRRTERTVTPAGTPNLNIRGNTNRAGFGGGDIVERGTALARETVGIVFRDQQRREQEERETIAAKNREIQEIQLKAKKEADTTAALEADVKAAELQNRIVGDVNKMKGKNSLQASDFAQSEWEKGIEEINESLFNDEQKNAFGTSALRRSISLKKSVSTHVDNELRAWEENVYKASVQTTQEEIAQNYTDIEAMTAGRDKLIALIDREAENKGLGKEWARDKKAQIGSQTHRMVVERMIFDGQEDAAQAYANAVKSEIRSSDVKSIQSALRSAKSARGAADTQAQGIRYLQAVRGELDNNKLEEWLEEGVIKASEFRTLSSAVNDIWDDERIAPDEKTKVTLEVWGAFKELRGTEVNPKTRRVIKQAKGNDLERIQGFRELVVEKQKYLPKSLGEDFLLYTNNNFEDAKLGKFTLVDSMLNRLQNLGVDQQDVVTHLASVINPIFAPQATLATAKELIDETVDRAIVKTNPNRANYNVGDWVRTPAGTFQIESFDPVDGEPILKIPKKKTK